MLTLVLIFLAIFILPHILSDFTKYLAIGLQFLVAAAPVVILAGLFVFNVMSRIK